MHSALSRIRRICLSLPDTEEGTAWGHPSFRVCGRMFCGYEQVKGIWTVGFRVTSADAEFRKMDPRVVAVHTLGRSRGVSIDVARIDDWDSLRSDIIDSYRLVAPKRSVAKLDDTNESRHRTRRGK